MWSILALGAAERLIHHVIDLDAISRIQLNKLQGKMLRVGNGQSAAFSRCFL